MPLREEFEKEGNWLFKHRSYLPLALFPLLLIAIRYSGHTKPPGNLWEICSLGISFVGLFVRVFTVAYVPGGTSGRNTDKQVAESLNTKGMYSIVRHPLYLGNFVIFLGMVLFTQVWWFILISVLLFWLYYERIIFAEEEFLRKKFGEIYINWANEVPAFIPHFRRWVKPDLKFSLKTALRREYSGFFSIIVSFSIIRLLMHLIMRKKFYLEPHWILLFLFGLGIYLTLRTLKRKTKILNVPGR